MRWCVLCVAAVLAGCSLKPARPVSPSLATPTQDSSIIALDNWRADGRIAIQRGDQAWSASLNWLKRKDAFRLRLMAPLGRGTYQLAGDNVRVALIAPDGRRFVARDAQALMIEHLGWSIPLDGAHYWLRGLAAPGVQPSSERRDDTGLLRDLDQAGWRISVLRRMSVGDFELPSKLYMHYDDIKVRIVISAWDLTQE